VWDGDDAPDTLHFATYDDATTIAIATLLHRPHDLAPGPDSWQLRGMATHPDRQGTGLGQRLLAFLLEHCRDIHGGQIVWCNARISAAKFYQRYGFQIVSGEFDIPGIGPHVVMRRPLGAAH